MSGSYNDPRLVRQRRIMGRQGTDLWERTYSRTTGGSLTRWVLVRPDGSEEQCTRAEGECAVMAIGQTTIEGWLMGEGE